MDSLRLLPRSMGNLPTPIPTHGLVISTVLSMLTMAILAICLTRRIQATTNWDRVPLTRWLVFVIYADSLIFIFATAVLEHGLGLNTNITVCESAILLCLACYLSTKLLIYYFLIEKVYVVRAVSTPRLKSKLWCFNVFGLLLPYCVVVAINFVYRVAFFREDGTCIIGLQAKSVMPLIIFDAVLNFYLTLLFVIPLRKLYSYKNSPNSVLRTITLRSFVGSLATLTSSVVNLTVLMVLHGEAAWICLMCCNADILFSVLVLHWVTSKDKASSSSSNNTYSGQTASHIERSKNSTGPMGPYSVVDKSSIFGTSKAVDGRVTTHISAQESKDREDKDTGIEWSGNRLRGGIPLDRIRVQVGQVIEVESRSRSDARTVRSEGDEDIVGVRRVSQGGSGRSTEELVERP